MTHLYYSHLQSLLVVISKRCLLIDAQETQPICSLILSRLTYRAQCTCQQCRHVAKTSSMPSVCPVACWSPTSEPDHFGDRLHQDGPSLKRERNEAFHLANQASRGQGNEMGALVTSVQTRNP